MKHDVHEIGVMPIVKKYLSYHYAVEPFELTYLTNCIANFLAGQLQREFDKINTIKPVNASRFTQTLSVRVNGSYTRQYGRQIFAPSSISYFNSFVRETFAQQMAIEVNARMRFGMGIKQAIDRILNRYGIAPDELSMEVAIEYCFRYNRKIERLNKKTEEEPDQYGIVRPLHPTGGPSPWGGVMVA